MNHTANLLLDGISILIPCAGRTSLLEALLKSVQDARQAFHSPTEVLLLDNSKSWETEKVKKLANSYDASYHAGSNNLSQKRNRGIELAKYDLVLFLDSDCLVDKNILDEHYKAYLDLNVGGCLGSLTFVGKNTRIWASVEQTGVLESFNIPVNQSDTLWGPTANISFRRRALLEVGGFDVAFSRPGGEDVDLGFRMTDAGWKISCNPAAVAYHSKDTWSSFREVYGRFLRYGSADALLIRKHPSRTIVDFPLTTHYTVLLSIFALAWLPLTNYWSLLLPLVWSILSILFYAIITKLSNKSLTHNSWISIMELILFTGLDFGRLIGALKYREMQAIYKRIIFFDDQFAVDWPGMSMSVLASTLALLTTLSSFSLFLYFIH